MKPSDEEDLLQSVALQNARAILLARRRAEEELVLAKEDLELRTQELSRSLAMMQSTLEATNDAILATDGSGRVTGFNERFLKMWRLSGPDALNDHHKVVNLTSGLAADPNGFLKRIDEIYSTSPTESYDLLELTDGRVIERYSRSQRVDGNNVGRVWSYRDITRRREADRQLAQLAAIVESSHDAIIGKNLDGTITSWNKGAELVFGYTSEEAVGQPVSMLKPAGLLDEEAGIIERISRGETVGHFETVRVRKDGALLDISLTVSPVFDSQGRIVGASKIARDITQQKHAREAIRDREIMQRLVEAQESERQRIARDLHDHLGQKMTALRLKIESIVQQSTDAFSLHNIVDEIRQYATLIDRDIAFLSWELRPTELEQLGLEDALGSFVREWSNQYGIEAEFHSNLTAAGAETVRLPQNAETNLYRIVQEALNNAVKHADPGNVCVLLQRQKDHLVLVIEDDGAGFDQSSTAGPDARRGLGLVGMQERAALLKGTLEIESQPGKGTTVLARVPT